MTPTNQQLNERIATEICGRNPYPKDYTPHNAPNFIEDPSTGMMIVAGLRRLGTEITFYRDRDKAQPFEFCELISMKHMKRVGWADTPHAALIAAVLEYLKEGE